MESHSNLSLLSIIASRVADYERQQSQSQQLRAGPSTSTGQFTPAPSSSSSSPPSSYCVITSDISDDEEDPEPQPQPSSPSSPSSSEEEEGAGSVTYSDLEEIHIDMMEPESVPNPELLHSFILTRCSQDTLGLMLTNDFLPALRNHSNWRLWLTELTFGYLQYVVRTGRNPWTHEPLALTLPDFQALVSARKISMLKTGFALPIPLRFQTLQRHQIAHIYVTSRRMGAFSTSLTFETEGRDGSIQSSVTIHGTGCMSDMMLMDYPTRPEMKGFPIRFLFANEPQKFRISSCFSKQLARMREMLADTPGMHFLLDFEDSDRLIDLWYLKHLADEFHTKVHVTQDLLDFVTAFVPQFADCFDTTNSHNQCKFHYDCARLGWLSDCCESYFERTRGGRKIRKVSVRIETVVFTDNPDYRYSDEETRLALPFIHDL